MKFSISQSFCLKLVLHLILSVFNQDGVQAFVYSLAYLIIIVPRYFSFVNFYSNDFLKYETFLIQNEQNISENLNLTEKTSKVFQDKL